VTRARKIQAQRFANEKIFANAQMPQRLLRKYCRLDDEGEKLIQSVMQRLNLSARAYTRVLKLSRTIADLEGANNIQPQHVAEAVGYRSLDRG
jgi:magnesium chelatase family protein